VFVNILLLPNEHELALKTSLKVLILILFPPKGYFHNLILVPISPKECQFKLQESEPETPQFDTSNWNLKILVPTLYKFTKLGHLIHAVT
jgi:hypothetical protein